MPKLYKWQPVYADLVRRSGGLCEARIARWCHKDQPQYAGTVHHIKQLLHKGSTELVNILHVCRSCHDLIHTNNPDKRCRHPKARDTEKKTWSAAGYCWSYASHVDGDKAFKNMKKICQGCNLWRGGSK